MQQPINKFSGKRKNSFPKHPNNNKKKGCESIIKEQHYVLHNPQVLQFLI